LDLYLVLSNKVPPARPVSGGLGSLVRCERAATWAASIALPLLDDAHGLRTNMYASCSQGSFVLNEKRMALSAVSGHSLKFITKFSIWARSSGTPYAKWVPGPNGPMGPTGPRPNGSRAQLGQCAQRVPGPTGPIGPNGTQTPIMEKFPWWLPWTGLVNITIYI